MFGRAIIRLGIGPHSSCMWIAMIALRGMVDFFSDYVADSPQNTYTICTLVHVEC